jgi:hypothetical protein
MACLPDRNLCTPDHALVEATGPGAYHLLPVNLEWGHRSNLKPPRRDSECHGIACRNLQALGPHSCNGPTGDQSGAGALITRVRMGAPGSPRRPNRNFHDNQGSSNSTYGYGEGPHHDWWNPWAH